VVSVGATSGIDTIASSVSYSLASTANVNVLELTGASRTGTANTSADLLQAHSTGDTLKGGSGVDVLEGASKGPGSIST
jgi:Ca2+-binding RTX toxin-like protein